MSFAPCVTGQSHLCCALASDLTPNKHTALMARCMHRGAQPPVQRHPDGGGQRQQAASWRVGQVWQALCSCWDDRRGGQATTSWHVRARVLVPLHARAHTDAHTRTHARTYIHTHGTCPPQPSDKLPSLNIDSMGAHRRRCAELWASSSSQPLQGSLSYATQTDMRCGPNTASTSRSRRRPVVRKTSNALPGGPSIFRRPLRAAGDGVPSSADDAAAGAVEAAGSGGSGGGAAQLDGAASRLLRHKTWLKVKKGPCLFREPASLLVAPRG